MNHRDRRKQPGRSRLPWHSKAILKRKEIHYRHFVSCVVEILTNPEISKLIASAIEIPVEIIYHPRIVFADDWCKHEVGENDA